MTIGWGMWFESERRRVIGAMMIRWERVVLPIVMGEDRVGILLDGEWRIVGRMCLVRDGRVSPLEQGGGKHGILGSGIETHSLHRASEYANAVENNGTLKFCFAEPAPSTRVPGFSSERRVLESCIWFVGEDVGQRSEALVDSSSNQ